MPPGRRGRGRAEYLLTVKGNQPELLDELVDLFRPPAAPLLPTARRTGTGRGPRRGRPGPAANSPGGDEWPGPTTACRGPPRDLGPRGAGVLRDGEAYPISSLGLRRHTPAGLPAWNRGHWGVENGGIENGDREWGVENRPHYVRGVTMGEDACRAREGSAPQVLAGVRNAGVRNAGVRNAGVRNAGVALLRGDGWEDIASATTPSTSPRA